MNGCHVASSSVPDYLCPPSTWLQFTFSSRSCCLKSSSSSESHSGNWYTWIPNLSISSRICSGRAKAVRFGAGEVPLVPSAPDSLARLLYHSRLTRSFSFRVSLGTRQSALAMSGTMFTFSCRAFMKPTSTGRSLQRATRGWDGHDEGRWWHSDKYSYRVLTRG